jgi:FlaA1/EpsC-like NDP-sugar epimerase
LISRPETTDLRARWRTWIVELPRYYKRAVLVSVDFLLLCAALWIITSLRYEKPFVPQGLGTAILLLAGPVVTILTFAYTGLYRLVTRYISYRGTIQIFLSVGLSVLIWSLLVFMSGQLGVPRVVIISYGLLGAALIALNRQAAGLVLKSAGISFPSSFREKARKPALIYGAGPMGIQLLQAVKRAGDREIVGFVDDSPSMWGQFVAGVKVFPPAKIERLVERGSIREILLALPGTQRRERRKILQELERFPLEVKILPAYEDISSGRVGINDLRPVEVGDLLGRDTVLPNTELLARNTKGKSILVTGAGGSIGSELVRQIIKQQPRRIVLFDFSEIALYTIDMDVREIVAGLGEDSRPAIETVLGSVLDPGLITDVIRRHEIETIYHAAAYKHVPIVEHNPIAGHHNNVFGALVIAECARKLGVERVVLISTDKAVRPTNIMGASKRLAELVLQAEAAEPGVTTVFTMVRFGNVLDSSGSVVRRFRKQIEAGGPVTVTHPDVTRYFMSIPEAAELVIQAGAMAAGGEVFVLHMGEPVKIDDLARLMVHLSGLEVRTENNPGGDIAISYTGLRPGEKLYEELLIGAHTTTTEHPRILKSDEPFLSHEGLKQELDLLKTAMAVRDRDAIQAMLARTVEGYAPHGASIELTGVHTAWNPTSRTLH